MNITAFDIAERFIGTEEITGQLDNPQVLAMLRLDASWPENDEVPWCSAFANYIAWLLRLPRSKSLRARSWLKVGKPVALTATGGGVGLHQLENARVGFDVVILARGTGPQPGPQVIDAPGHVGFYAGHAGDLIEILGGNQGNQVSIARYSRSRILGVRRLREES